MRHIFATTIITSALSVGPHQTKTPFHPLPLFLAVSVISYRICPIRIEAAAGIRWGENFRLLSEPARIRTRTPRRYHIIRTTGEHGALNSQNPAAENKTKKPQCLIRNRDTCPLLSYPCWVYSCLLLSTPVYSCLHLWQLGRSGQGGRRGGERRSPLGR